MSVRYWQEAGKLLINAKDGPFGACARQKDVETKYMQAGISLGP